MMPQGWSFEEFSPCHCGVQVMTYVKVHLNASLPASLPPIVSCRTGCVHITRESPIRACDAPLQVKEWIETRGVDDALELTYNATRPFTPAWHEQTLLGMVRLYHVGPLPVRICTVQTPSCRLLALGYPSSQWHRWPWSQRCGGGARAGAPASGATASRSLAAAAAHQGVLQHGGRVRQGDGRRQARRLAGAAARARLDDERCGADAC